MKTWFRFQNATSDPSVVDIHIVDIIGGWVDELWGGGDGIVTAKAFLDQLSKLAESVKTIRLHINSPGGDVFAAVAMANALRDQQVSKGRTVDVVIEGLAASSASVVAMAGGTVRMADNALLMVHNPWTVGMGNAAELRKVADELDTVRGSIVATYRWHSKLSDEDLIALMDAETWMDADEAIERGFATDKVEGLKAAAAITPRALASLSVPEKFRARVEALVEPPAKTVETPKAAAAVDVLRLCREGDCLDLAEELIAAGSTQAQAETRIAEKKAERQAATLRADQIRAACRMAHVEQFADSYIAGGMSVDGVKAQLLLIAPLRDSAQIDGSLKPGTQTSAKSVINTSAVYAERNKSKKE